MKTAGRKTSAAYELYGFIPRVDNGKHSAICTSCNRVLQNTAAVRLQKHRNSCLAARASGGDPFPNLEIKRRKAPKAEALEHINSNIKTEQSNIEFEDAHINENANDNDNTTYEDTVVEPCITIEQEENPIPSPITTAPGTQQQPHQQHQQQQAPEPFESYHATATNTNNSVLDIDGDDMDEVNDEDLINIEEELDVIQNLMPRSKVSKQLQDELSKAETEYYRSKAAYFVKLTENCKIKRTLMLLESRKLQLEIEKLTNES